jgi:hypothetical protein
MDATREGGREKKREGGREGGRKRTKVEKRKRGGEGMSE